MSKKTHLYVLWTSGDPVADALEKLNIEVKYWGVPLTEVLADGERLLTI